MSKYLEFLAAQRKKYGSAFDPSGLAKQFIPYFGTECRIKVHIFSDATVNYGTVGITTGWRPAFLLMANRRCIGSSTLLSDNDTVLAEKKPGQKTYTPQEIAK